MLCFCPVRPADRRSASHLLHDLPGLRRRRAEPALETQAPAAHHGLAASVDGLLHQLREHGHRGAQAFQSPAGAPPGPRQGSLLGHY